MTPTTNVATQPDRVGRGSAGLSQPTYIAGVAESPLGKVLDHSELSMVAVAAREALDEAGMRLADVDGLFVNYMGEEGSVQVGEYLGIRPRYADSSDLGGGTFEAFIHHAMLAVAAGHCEVALIAYASRQRSRRSRNKIIQTDPGSLPGQLEVPHGLPVPIGHFGLIASRYMHQYGVTPRQAAEVAVAARQWAAMNPKAWSREPLTIDDVLASRVLCDPIRVRDMCVLTDGGGAIVVTNAARARDARKRAVRVLGAAESHAHWQLAQSPDITTTSAHASGAEAMRMAGIGPADVDVFVPYDVTTTMVLIQLEDLGFCGRGEGGDFVADGALAPKGRLPTMTSGGGLSYCHPGALGLLLLVEAVRQLRGECGERQVPDAEVTLVNGLGGLMSAAATVVLGRD